MIKIRHILIAVALLASSAIQGQTLTKILTDYAAKYESPSERVAKVKYERHEIDDANQSLTIYMSGGMQEHNFTPEKVDAIYNQLRAILPAELKNYKIALITDNHKIEDLVPNFFRKGKKAEDRMYQDGFRSNRQAPWVTNISRPYRATKGLEGNHIALWQSHGRYYRHEKDDWYWQRPRLFCTTEDLFTQTFVVPYIIPMLQNAGAVVFTPRERDWQRNEVIVDNDQPNRNGTFIETNSKNPDKQRWAVSPLHGYANLKTKYQSTDNPFTMGSARYIATDTESKDEAQAKWIPNIPEDGRYAVYVSYHSFENSTTEAHYTVYHKGGMTEFTVNQRMGGGTWVYLGTFDFAKGEHDFGMVRLSNITSSAGLISADAVRFGGGMGNVVPLTTERVAAMDQIKHLLNDTIVVDSMLNDSTPYTPLQLDSLYQATVTCNNRMVDSLAILVNQPSPITPSQLPRFAEAAKYSALWYGFPYEIHSEKFGANEYNNDIRSRSMIINRLAGGSAIMPDTTGMKVPLELSMAFHSDAGFKKDHSLVGSLSIYTTDCYDGQTAARLDRYTSRDLTSMMLTNLTTDLAKYGWVVRNLWNRDYGESRDPRLPACILEMLSHQNFADMRLGYDPRFKFDFCRSVYKSIVKYLATIHRRPYVIQPLPVHNFATSLDEEKDMVRLSWDETVDPLEPTARPHHYIVYTRVDSNGFNNGVIVNNNECKIDVIPGHVYSFKVTAVNDGGESFPSEILSAHISNQSKGQILIVNAFTRLEGPASICTDKQLGFDLDADPGVQYGAFAGFCGRQKNFNPKTMGSDSGCGASGSDLEGKIIMGNTFDYPYIHGRSIAKAGGYSYCSVSEEALNSGKANMANYKMVDVIYGVQKDFNPATRAKLDAYAAKGGRYLVSGANLNDSISVTDKSITGINGCGTSFSIYREMNQYSYSVPRPSVLPGDDTHFPILTYSDGQSAAIAHDGQDYKSIEAGFPFEAITDRTKADALMKAFISFLLP
ncbi:MAG: xanthan lyase [Bacteroidaceae bacterium]|nr:xanthan lyase [Bacteroidaceae bacterium]